MTAGEPPRARLLLAFASVYILWGSTYLAIRIGIETIPPFLMAGTRFLLAGSILYAWARFRGIPRPTTLEWRSAAIIGTMLLFIGNGGVTWAEQKLPSSIAALLVATVPVWIVLFEWLSQRGTRPGALVFVGVAAGFLGVVLLIGPGEILSGSSIDLGGVGALMVATVSWAAGSIYSRRAILPSSPLMATGAQTLAGGGVLLAAALLTGEGTDFSPGVVSLRSFTAVVYLSVFGSIIAFTAYVWLLRVVSPAKVATYAYVNPVIAILLGWGLADEPFGGRTLVAAAVIILSVVLIVSSRRSTSSSQPRE